MSLLASLFFGTGLLAVINNCIILTALIALAPDPHNKTSVATPPKK